MAQPRSSGFGCSRWRGHSHGMQEDWEPAAPSMAGMGAGGCRGRVPLTTLTGICFSFLQYEKILKLTSDAKLESGDVKATIAVLSFILSSAAKHNVDSESLSSELQQLGLPKEHATGLCRSYEEKQSPLQDSLRACSLRLSQLDSVSWRVDYTLSSSELQEVNEPLVHLMFGVRDRDSGVTETVPMAVSADKFRVLLAGKDKGGPMGGTAVSWGQGSP
nr:PREDICTED: COMM domain-containing protein 4 [Apteryx mantelli mantelli]